MSRLRKADAERLLDDYDADPESALAAALRRVLERDGDFDSLVAACNFDARRVRALTAREPAALDALAAELNEHRGLTSALA